MVRYGYENPESKGPASVGLTNRPILRFCPVVPYEFSKSHPVCSRFVITFRIVSCIIPLLCCHTLRFPGCGRRTEAQRGFPPGAPASLSEGGRRRRAEDVSQKGTQKEMPHCGERRESFGRKFPGQKRLYGGTEFRGP